MQSFTLAPRNSPYAIQARVQAGAVTWAAPLLMLAHRLVLFLAFQAVFALALAARGAAQPWEASIAWWPLSATLTNLVSLALLRALARREGMRFRDYLNFDRRAFVSDVLVTLGVVVVSAPLAYLPNVGLGALLFGDPQQTVDLMFRPLPLWAAGLALVAFPLTVALAELPTYYGYAMPRLAALTGRPWLAVLLAAAAHSLQHATLPLIFDARFIVWRSLMFAPFALLVALVLHWRPRLLPYLMVVHALLDLAAVWSIMAASTR